MTLVDYCNAGRLEKKVFHYLKSSGAKQPMLPTLECFIPKVGCCIELQSIHEVSYAWPDLGAILNHCEISISGAQARVSELLRNIIGYSKTCFEQPPNARHLRLRMNQIPIIF